MPETELKSLLTSERVDLFDDRTLKRLALRFGVNIAALSVPLDRLGYADGALGEPVR